MNTFMVCLLIFLIISIVFYLLHCIDVVEKEKKDILKKNKLLVYTIISSENAFILNPLLENGRRNMKDVDRNKLSFNNKTGEITFKGNNNVFHTVELYVD